MNKNDYTCTFCNSSFETRYQLMGHRKYCKEDDPKPKKEKKIHSKTLNCKFCDKQFDSPGQLGGHTTGCSLNPNKNTYNDHRKANHVSWNRGLTMDTDERVKKGAIKLKEGYDTGKIIPSWLGKNHSVETITKLKAYGGYRKGCGRGKNGWYKGYWCDSSWELAWVIYHLDNNIKFERCMHSFNYIYNNTKYKYHPDFIIENTLYEIKAFETERHKIKYTSISNDFVLNIMYKNDIEPLIKWVKQKYNVKDITLLYDWQVSRVPDMHH